MVRMPGCRRVRRSRGGHRRPAPKWLARRLEDVEKAAGRATLQAARQAVEALRETVADHQVQIDVKFIEPIAGVTGRRGGRNKYYQFTAIDDCTRLRVLRIYPQRSGHLR
jgi:hypothetical protein